MKEDVSSIFEMLISLISTRKRIENKLCLQGTRSKKEAGRYRKSSITCMPKFANINPVVAQKNASKYDKMNMLKLGYVTAP